MLYCFAFSSKVYARVETDFSFGVEWFPGLFFPMFAQLSKHHLLKNVAILTALRCHSSHQVFLCAQVYFCSFCSVSSVVLNNLSPESQSFHYLSFVLSVDTQQRKILPPCSLLLECLEYRQFLGLGLSI